MAQTRQFGHVPDIDDAPDIYETPELTDDTSTIPASNTVRSVSSASSYDDAQEEAASIDRRRVGADEARSRFEPARVSARDVDFSGKLSRQSKSYRVSSRRRRFAGDAEELGDFSEEEEESFDHRLARLRQEIEEVKAELQAQEAAQQKGLDEGEPKQDDGTAEADVERLSGLLDSVYAQGRGRTTGAEAQYMTASQRFEANGISNNSTAPLPNHEIFTSQDEGISIEQRTQILSKTSEVDQRLQALETALGLDSITSPDEASRPIVHTLNNLDRQLATLSSSSSADTLDTASHRVRQLTQEAERLAERQKATSPSSPGALPSARDAKASGSTTPKELDGNSKINALFGTLPTIESLSSSLPMVLERLRTLRLIHAGAGDASTILEWLEKRQAEQAAELESWQTALQKIESSMSEGEGVLTANVKLVSEWVKELEDRVGKLN